MDINITVTQLIIINHALRKERGKNPFPEGHTNDSRNAAIDLTRKRLDEFYLHHQGAEQKGKEGGNL